MSWAKQVIQKLSLAFRHTPRLCYWHMVNEQNLLLKNVSSCLMIVLRITSTYTVLQNISTDSKVGRHRGSDRDRSPPPKPLVRDSGTKPCKRLEQFLFI